MGHLLLFENKMTNSRQMLREGIGTLGIQHGKMKEKKRKECNRRVRLILRTEVNGRNKVEAINSLAFPVI